MPISDRIGGFIKPGYFPLKIPDAPTIGAASTSEAIGSNAISIAFTAPSNVGGGAVTSYEAVATDTVTAATFTETGSSTPIVISGLSNGQTYTVTVSATNAYGSSVLSAASNSATAAVFTGQLWAWGDNTTYGQLGTGNTTDYSSPVQVGALTTWKLVAVGGGYGSAPSSFAIKHDGTLWASGRNNYGQLGQGNTTDRSSPVQIGALTTWSKLANGNGRYGLSVKTDGTLWAWGQNASGCLGLGNATNYSSPVQVGALTNWLDVSATYRTTLALKTDGTMWSWGANAYGQLGLGNTTYYSSPVQIGALTTWSAISIGGWWGMALKTDGTIWMWGANNSGQLGQGNTTVQSSPVQVGALTTWSKVAGGDTSYGLSGAASAIKTDGTLWMWGANTEGVLGQGNTTLYSSPVQVGALTDWAACSPAGNTQALKTDGTLWAWGDNSQGQLGDGSTTSRSSPVQIGAATTWVAIAPGSITKHRWAIRN